MSKNAERHENVTPLRQRCQTCPLSDLCLPGALSADEVDRLDRLVDRKRPMHKGDFLFHAGEPFRYLYALRTGAVKTLLVSDEGEQQISGFYLPGELLGFDAISVGKHRTAAVALQTTNVCCIPFESVERLASEIPNLSGQLLRAMSDEIYGNHLMINSLAQHSAEERLAAVLVNLGNRFARRGLSGLRFRLPMPRHDLSNYLGLAPATMSRLFRRFTENGWIDVQGREISLLDRTTLGGVVEARPSKQDPESEQTQMRL